MRLLPVIFIVLIQLTSCGKPESKPDDILTREEMVAVLSDLYVTEEKVKRLSLSRDSSMKVFDRMKGMLFEKHAVSDSVFKRSLDYYWERPEQMEELYTIVIDTLNLREQRKSIEPQP